MFHYPVAPILLAALALFASPARAAGKIDCPLRDASYSADPPLIDVLLNPDAKAVLARDIPSLAQGFPPQFISTVPPTFASILTPRIAVALKRMKVADLDTLDRDLRAVPLTAAAAMSRPISLRLPCHVVEWVRHLRQA